jgi:membrane-associated protease RseP (regulator of RpoE activity)
MKENRSTNDEVLARDEQHICDMLGCLERVEAPANFEFRVKGRIAARRQSDTKRRWVPASAAIAAPLGLALAIGGYFVISTSYSPGVVAEPQTAELKPAVLPQAEPSFSVLPPVAAASPVEAETVALSTGPATSRPIPVSPGIKRTNLVRPPANFAGGSIDETRRISPEINVSLPAKEALLSIGVDANYGGSSWTVGSVRSGTAAARSGLKPGDVIEAVNGRPLDVNTSFEGKFTGHSVRVRREGKIVQVDLH